MFSFYTFYTVLSIIFLVLMVLFSIILTVIVVMQDGNSNNIGAITGGSESFFGKNKAKSMDAKLKRLTIYLAISILVTSILFFIVQILLKTLD
ncbi:MAG TPA: preprotein translocase subunit SecG [Clostridia bacterium]|nr:preprotein translocase subunit SecG [Clostridia bacterium]